MNRYLGHIIVIFDKNDFYWAVTKIKLFRSNGAQNFNKILQKINENMILLFIWT